MRRFSFCLLALIITGTALPAFAEPVAVVPIESRHPLAVIRFNQPRVQFRDSLERAVRAAVGVKPDVSFDVLLRPAEPDADIEDNANLARVVNDINSFGIPSERILTDKGQASGQRYDEVEVYVR